MFLTPAQPFVTTPLESNVMVGIQELPMFTLYLSQQTSKDVCTNLLIPFCFNLFAEPENCTEKTVRLADGAIDQEGRVEMCINKVWGSLCSDGWDQTDAHVLCTQRHLGDGGKYNCLVASGEKRDYIHCMS